MCTARILKAALTGAIVGSALSSGNDRYHLELQRERFREPGGFPIYALAFLLGFVNFKRQITRNFSLEENQNNKMMMLTFALLAALFQIYIEIKREHLKPNLIPKPNLAPKPNLTLNFLKLMEEKEKKVTKRKQKLISPGLSPFPIKQKYSYRYLSVFIPTKNSDDKLLETQENKGHLKEFLPTKKNDGKLLEVQKRLIILATNHS